jgi:hypothetical protein
MLDENPSGQRMQVVINPRQKICQAVAEFSESCSLSEVKEALDPLFQEFEIIKDVGTGISPLLLACDRGIVNCLEYLKCKSKVNQWASACIGDPLYQSPEELNTPLHHAATVGCWQAIPILCDMGSTTPLVLGSARNAHGDTPLMMAATSGQLEFCQFWHLQCMSHSHASTARIILSTWELKNVSDDSCLSLACGHGHVPVVNFLLSSDCGVSIDSGVIMKCQILHERMKAALRRDPSLLYTRKEQVENVRLCLDVMRAKAAILADAAARELLTLKSGEAISSCESKSKTSFESKSKKKWQKPRATKPREPPNALMPSTRETSNTDMGTPNPNPRQGIMEVTTLNDGTKAVRVEGSALPESYTLVAVRRAQQSTDKMFRDRFQQGQISSEVDSFMRALCLDISMLLYTPHGMAMDLSPSQLDAVQDILRRQLEGVQEARRIQERLHASPSTSAAEK